MEHIKNDVEVLRRIHAVLAPEGWLVLSVPYAAQPAEFTLAQSSLDGILRGQVEDGLFCGEKHWRSGYNEATLQEKLKAAGFHIVRVVYSTAHCLLPDIPWFFPINCAIDKLGHKGSRPRKPGKINSLAQKRSER